MGDIYYYDEQTDEMKHIGELSDSELISLTADVEDEVDARVYESLPVLESFEGSITVPASLEFKLMFKDWAGIVPRRIGVPT